MKEPRKVVRDALQNLRGDDLERAEKEFMNYSEEELDKKYLQSGKTCREILSKYQEHRKEIDNAILWVNTL